MKSYLLFIALVVSLLLLLVLTLCEGKEPPPPEPKTEIVIDEEATDNGYSYEEDVPL